VRYAFVAEHQGQFGVRAMCPCLAIQPSGFYAWQKNPLSHRAQEDVRQTALIRQAWKDSGKVYGYRKLHDDLLDQGETCCPNRVARLTSLAGIKAQIGYKRRPGSSGGRPSAVAANTLDRQFDVAQADRAWVTDITYIRTMEGFCLSGSRARPILPPCCGMVDAKPSDNRCGFTRPAHGGLAAKAEEPRAHPFRSGFAVHQYRLGGLHQGSQSGTLHEPQGKLPR